MGTEIDEIQMDLSGHDGASVKIVTTEDPVVELGSSDALIQNFPQRTTFRFDPSLSLEAGESYCDIHAKEL